MFRKIYIIFSLLILVSGVLCRKSEEKCQEYSQLFKDKIQVSHIDGPPSTLGKESTTLGEFPHMAALGFQSEKGTGWLCGGSLISDEYILTSAVCTKGPSGPVKIVRLCDHNIQSKEDDANVQEINIEKIIVHPEYKPPSVYNDIALLKLEKKVKFTKSLRPACLSGDENLDIGTEVSAIGWGKINFGESASPTLKKVYLDLFTHAECKEAYGTVSKRKLKDGIVEKTLVCAGGRTISKDTCKGDAGGPLQFLNKDKNIYEIIGIASFGKVCGKIGVPSVYTRVAAYIPWIENIVWA